MSKGTLLALFVLVLALGALWFVKERALAHGGPALEEYPLCPGFAPEHVRSLHIDNLERSFQLTLERDAAGRWSLTDPVAYPAQGALVSTLLQMLADARGESVAEPDLAQFGLDPPAVVIECVEVTAGGERRVRVELGKVDVVGSLVYARVPGHPGLALPGGPASEVFRTTRALVNTLVRIPDDYRDHKATTLAAQEVLSIRRSGQIFRPSLGRFDDLQFDALLGPDGWKRVTRATVSLDPTAMGLLARGAAELNIESFADDSPQDLKRYGLDPPLFTLALEDTASQTVTLCFGHDPREDEHSTIPPTWYCQRQGYAHVWEVSGRSVELLSQPADLFFDQLVVRMLRTDVVRLELQGGGVTRVLAKDKDGWTVQAGGASAAAPYPADPAAVEAALALLERVQLGEYLPAAHFEPADPPLAFAVVLKNGARLGGALGAAARDEQSGAQGYQYLRAGDEVVALIGADVAELCQRPLDSFRSRRVHQVKEALVRWVELTHDAHTFTFVNSGDNVWNPKGQTIQAPPDFVQSLDGLLALEAKQWFEAGAAPPATDSLQVVLQLREGEPLRFTLARSAEGRATCTTAAGQTAEIDAALLARLLKLF